MSERVWAVVSVGMYALVFGFAIALHIRGHRPRPLAPSVGVAFGWVMRRGPGRIITLLFWCWVGFHFFAR